MRTRGEEVNVGIGYGLMFWNMQIRELGWVMCVKFELSQDGVAH